MTLRQLITFPWISVPRLSQADSANRLHAGRALLIDVREPKEWREGVAQSAALLSLRDLCWNAQRWQPFLKATGERELILYCGAGVRSNIAARLLRSNGYRAFN